MLVKQQQRLQGIWYYFPFGYYFFGYADTRKVIAHALEQIGVLTQIALDQASQDMPAMSDRLLSEKLFKAQESGKCQAYLHDFWTDLETMQVDDPVMQQAWNSIKQALKNMYADHDKAGCLGLFVVDELLHYLSQQKTTVNVNLIQKPVVWVSITGAFFKPASTNAVQSLIARLQAIKQAIHRDHPRVNPLSSELFLSRKEAQMKQCLQAHLGKEVYQSIEHFEIKPGHTGFKPYYEVNIKASRYEQIQNGLGFKIDPRHGRIMDNLAENEQKCGVLNAQRTEILRQISTDTPNSNGQAPAAEVSIQNQHALTVKERVQQIFSGRITDLTTYLTTSLSSLWSADFLELDGWTDCEEEYKTSSNRMQPDLSSANRASVTQQSLSQAASQSLADQLQQLDSEIAKLEADIEVKKERLQQYTPNLLSRRFETLAELLVFESDLRALSVQANTNQQAALSL
jgi:hypothetical protein